MGARSIAPRLSDIVEAIMRIRDALGDVDLQSFESDWRRQWLVERGVEIISEASRHLPSELKGRHPGIPWRKVAGIGNILRHDYESVAAAVIWKLARDDLEPLQNACRAELDAMSQEERGEG
jgi:uncharacterized protein with HEPN domain